MTSVNTGYALGQLERALLAATSSDPALQARARARVEAWRRVVDGMASGALSIGSRRPTAAPAWATLEVLHGGFASGALAAGGPATADEQALAKRLGGAMDDRRAIALHYLSDAGRAELRAMLASGCFRVDVPEEAALLSVVALLDRGAVEHASAVLDEIAPFFGELRFHPAPSARPLGPVSTVHVETVGETAARVRAITTPLAVRRMNEALAVWAPFLDRAADLFRETVVEGAPCRVFPEDFFLRARALVEEYLAARAEHRLCLRPHRENENLGILIGALTRLTTPASVLSPRELGRVRVALAGHEAKHGAAGSERRAAHRAEQLRVAALPQRGDSATAVAERLAALPPDAALSSLESLAAPLAEGTHAGSPLWPSVVGKLHRCLDASVEELVERGVLTSGEAIARVLPQISAHVRALGFADPALARLYAATDAAFRRRRSLLLLDYEHQVRLGELPWVAALEHFRSDDGSSREAAHRLFASVSALAISAFPHAILPNPLVEELRALARRAGLDLPFVDELAADIFMGGFTAKFAQAAAIVAERLRDTVYVRYYAIPVAEVLAIAESLPSKPGKPVAAFGALCERMAGVAPGRARSIAFNARVIEQQQILTTQNLVPVIDQASLDRASLPDLADRAFAWLTARVQTGDARRSARNAAYAWRQAIAYLSLAPPGAVEAFLERAQLHLAEQREGVRARLTPILDGLATAHAGGTPRVRLLAASPGPHPLLDE